MAATRGRRAVAVAVRREDGLVLAVRRPDEPGEELAGLWGLPAATLAQGESDEEGIRRIGREKLGAELTIGRALGHGEQERDGYTLRMSVYEASIAGEPRLSAHAAAETTLYTAVDWLPVEAFRGTAERGSLCCRVLVEAALGRSNEPRGRRFMISDELRSKMVQVARDLRRESTPSEELLWEALRNRRLDGHKFRRQRSVGPFVVDFYCVEQQLVVEVDGPIHLRQQAADAERQALLEATGLRVLRLSSELVERDLESALALIRTALTPGPSPGTGRGETGRSG